MGIPKVKTFVSTKAITLDEKINKFLEENGDKICSLSIRPFCTYGGGLVVGAMMTYYDKELSEE